MEEKKNRSDSAGKEGGSQQQPQGSNPASSFTPGERQQNPQRGQQQNPQQGQQQSQQGGQKNRQQGGKKNRQQGGQQNPQQGQQKSQQGSHGGKGQGQQQWQQGSHGGKGQGQQQSQQGQQQSQQGGQQNPQQGQQKSQQFSHGGKGQGQQQFQQGGQKNRQQGGQQNPQQSQQKSQQGSHGGKGQGQQQWQQGSHGGKEQGQQQSQQGQQQSQQGGQQNPQQGQQKSQQFSHGGKGQGQQQSQQGGQQNRQQRWEPQHGQQQSQRTDWDGKQQQQSTQERAWQRREPQQSQQQSQSRSRHQDGQVQQQQRLGQQQSRQSQEQAGTSSQQNRFQQQHRQDQQAYGRNQQQQLTLPASDEKPLPVKEISCNGIIRGTLGTPGVVEVNYLRLNFDKMPDEIYHYDIAIDPERPKKFLRAAFEQFKREMFPDTLMTFDGLKNCYSLERVKSPVELKVNVFDSNNRTKEFTVVMKETDTVCIDLRVLRTYQSERIFDKPMRALQALEVVLASSNHERGIRVGRSFFRRPHDVFDLEDGYEAWTGIYQAAILGEMPLLNVDIAHKSFPCESTLIQYLQKRNIDLNGDITRHYAFKEVEKFLNGINIIYTPPQEMGAPPKQYKVLSVGAAASQLSFVPQTGGSRITVKNYFDSRQCPLRYPNLPCLTVGSTVKQISLPMEFCSIPAGQALNRKDQSRQVEKMVRYAATSTNKRKQKIMELLLYFNHNASPIIRGFGLSIGSSFLKVPTRMLPSPMLEYLQGQTVNTFKGAWRMDGKKFLMCSKQPDGHKWAILYEDNKRGRGIPYSELERFKNDVIKTSNSLTMNLNSVADIKSYTCFGLQDILRDFAKNKYDLVFVVLAERGTTYAKIKQIAELEVGLLTQCIKEKTVNRTARDRSVFSNILLKVNGKLNGTNHKIAQDRDVTLLAPVQNVMFLGADVTHPSPDQRHIPSVVGVAASHDLNGACYNCQYRLQRSTVENIEDMESIACKHLEIYFKYQKKYPEQIIYYRDGVSDGQFPIVEREEIRAIKRACAKMRCTPKLTCVIVVKRHHTRFFPLKQPQGDRDFNNVEAGTVVDQYITHPNELQFFMVSHQSIQGTARPTRYNVIMNESNFNINLLQKLTYNLCHLFPRCNRSVSYPAPAYLAHLVAFRGRVYLEGTQNFQNLKREYDKRQIKTDFMARNPMYFI